MTRLMYLKWVLVLAVFLVFAGHHSLILGADKMMDQGPMAKEKLDTESSMKKDGSMMKEEDTMKKDSGMMKEKDAMQKDSGMLREEDMIKKDGGMMQEKKM